MPMQEKILKQKMKDDIAKAIIAKHGAPLTISEHEAIVSLIKQETAEAHAKVLESKGILLESKYFTFVITGLDPLSPESCLIFSAVRPSTALVRLLDAESWIYQIKHSVPFYLNDCTTILTVLCSVIRNVLVLFNIAVHLYPLNHD